MAEPSRIPPGGDTDRNARIQRVRVGLTGLAFVFLLVLLAAAILSSADVAPDHDRAGAPLAGGAAPAAANATTDEPREPLAEMGVVPGNPTSEATTNAVEPGGALQPPAR
jgi:hypothetical protein